MPLPTLQQLHQVPLTQLSHPPEVHQPHRWQQANMLVRLTHLKAFEPAPSTNQDIQISAPICVRVLVRNCVFLYSSLLLRHTTMLVWPFARPGDRLPLDVISPLDSS